MISLRDPDPQKTDTNLLWTWSLPSRISTLSVDSHSCVSLDEDLLVGPLVRDPEVIVTGDGSDILYSFTYGEKIRCIW